ncbi:hypothetical protein [Propionibacterium freudenreichii]|uniref:hypothetical protein n=1 Tax=Propionibacterium freudenreichii TaxID=1744 RepID=UPI002434344E|nr:hypothetical protein [Propionibacterium freudenreichii]
MSDTDNSRGSSANKEPWTGAQPAEPLTTGDLPAVQLTKEERDDAIRDTRRFDLRRFLGGLFVVYGVLVTGMGIARPDDDKALTGGIPINLYTGVAMFIIGLAFLLWDHLRPVSEDDILHSAEKSKAQSLQGEDLPASDTAR